MRRAVTTQELREAVRRLSLIAEKPLHLDGAYGGYRVEDGTRHEDFLGTGYVPKRKLLETIDAILVFERQRAR